jgi:hypothetical protein
MDEDEEEALHGVATGNEEGYQDNNDGGQEEPPRHDVEDRDEQHGHVEDQDEQQVEDDAVMWMPLTLVVLDPHLLLLKKS